MGKTYRRTATGYEPEAAARIEHALTTTAPDPFADLDDVELDLLNGSMEHLIAEAVRFTAGTEE